MQVLVIAAHPDDEVLGCGGTLCRLAEEGHQVHIAILGEGATSRSARREDAAPESVEQLRLQSEAAARLLGASDVSHYGLPDNRFDTVPLLDVVKIVESLVQLWQPQQLLTHNGSDLNIDHSVVHRAVLTATRPLPGPRVSELLLFEVQSSTEWAFGQMHPAFQPNLFVNIAGTIDKKIQAMECYVDEIRPYPHPRSPEMLRATAQRWGSTTGFEYAEAFFLARSLRA